MPYSKQDGETYEQHAQRICDHFGLRVEIRVGVPKCPKWDRSVTKRHCPYALCTGFHGKHWHVTIHAPNGETITFSFWDSVHNDLVGIRKPGVYDVLACLDFDGSTDPDEIAAEYGDIRPSQAIAIAEENKKLKRLVTTTSGISPHTEMIRALGEIR